MSPLALALCVAAITFGGAVVGLVLKHVLPEKLTIGAPRDAVASVVGLLTLLCALVLGLLIWTAYGVYSSQNATIQNYAMRVLLEDLALEDYGPEAQPARDGLRDGLQNTVNELWGPRFTDDFVTINYRAAISTMRAGQFYLDTLQPTTEQQKAALAAARSGPCLERPVAAADGARADQPCLLPADGDRGRVGDCSPVRLWLHVARQPGVHCRTRFGRACGIQRGLHDHGAERSVWRLFLDFAGDHRETDPGHHQQ